MDIEFSPQGYIGYVLNGSNEKFMTTGAARNYLVLKLKEKYESVDFTEDKIIVCSKLKPGIKYKYPRFNNETKLYIKVLLRWRYPKLISDFLSNLSGGNMCRTIVSCGGLSLSIKELCRKVKMYPIYYNNNKYETYYYDV